VASRGSCRHTCRVAFKLELNAEDLGACVSCGLCLPHCPTYRVTGDDIASPRGRILLMRAVQDGGAPIDSDVLRSMETCVQCRGCETACPSGVPFGRLMEGTREALAADHKITPRWQRLGFKVLEYPRLLRLGSSALAVLQRTRLVPSKKLGLPAKLPIRRQKYEASGRDVFMFTGCVMDAWQRDVHLATQRVIEATGTTVTPTGDVAPCCGALQTHAGLTPEARKLAQKMMAALAGEQPILVDSAGCGAAMKDYGHLVDTDAARAFSARVLDVHEWIADNIDQFPTVTKLDLVVAVQDPCHLRHVQRTHGSVRTALRPFVRELRELDDEGLCCGAGGSYSLMEPAMAGDIRQRKMGSIERADADVVASANPGCSLYLAAAGAPTRHPVEIIDEALRA